MIRFAEHTMHAQHGQRPQKWVMPQCQYYGSVKHNDPSARQRDCFLGVAF